MSRTRVNFNPTILRTFFNIKIRELCKSCKRFGKKATCPPYIDSVTYYKKLLPSYKNGILVIREFEVEDITKWEELGKTSSLELLTNLYKMRDELQSMGKHPIIFGAGSCKVCSDVCTFPCKHPEKSIVPLEATGIDVVALVEKLKKIKITFPIKDKFYRVGIILWD